MTKMTKKEASALGCLKRREEALANYYDDPSRCKHCGEIILVRMKERPYHAKVRLFCSDACRKAYVRPKKPTLRRSLFCNICGKEIQGERKYCDICRPIARAAGARKAVHTQTVYKKTIKQLKEDRKNYWSWRVQITKHARDAYMRSGKPTECLLCGYDKHFDVCHKKDVSLYSEETTVGEINDLNNLVALCKNHHWEFDHHLLDPKDKEILERA